MTKLYFNYSKILVSLMFLCCSSTYAQNIKVTGTIVDKSGVTLPGVNVLEKGTSNGTVTDFDGYFEIEMEEIPSELYFSYVGFQSQTLEVLSDTKVQITMEIDSAELEEVVLIGYGQVKKRDLIGAVGSVGTEKLEQTSPTGVLDALQGRLAGVQITSASGQPGDGANIRIRGTSTFNGGTDPLYVVDGQLFENIDFLNPSDIKTIDILKDGASAAIYGSRSANGVVLITTKGGTIGKPTFNVDYLRTYGQLAAKVPVANSLQVIEYTQLRNNQDLAEGDIYNFTFQNDTDFQEALSRTSVRDRLNVSLSGGIENAKYYWNVGYLNHDGILINTNFNRLSTKMNLDLKPTKWLTSGTRVSITADKSNTQGNENDPGNFLRSATNKRAFQQIFELDGSLVTRQNGGETTPFSDIALRKQQKRRYTTNLFQYLEAKLFHNLTFKATFGANFRYDKFEFFAPSTLDRGGNAEGRETNELNTGWIQEDYLTWTPQLGNNDKHNMNVVLGVSAQYSKREQSEIKSDKGKGFATDAIETLNSAVAFDNQATGGSASENSLFSLFGRTSYDYDGKYLMSLTVRQDGSSRFGANDRTGGFLASAIGWRFSEDLFKDSAIISDGKIRYSYAILGNERIGNYDSLELFTPGAFYNGQNGIRVDQIASPDLSWEETEQTNLGLDLSFLKKRINVTFDYYKKTTNKLLYNRALPKEAPVDEVRVNIGSIENTGIELAISGTIIESTNVRWTAGFNIARNDNKVLSLSEGLGFEINNLWRIDEGQPIGNFWGYTNLGVFAFDESNAFAENTGQQLQLQPGFQAGDNPSYTLNGAPYTGQVIKKTFEKRELKGGEVNFEDVDGIVDGDGNYDINSDDKQVIGNGQAKYFGGFNTEVTYKNFSLAVFFDYSFGADLYRDFDYGRNTGRFGGVAPSPEAIENAWREQGDITEYPALNRRATADNRIGANSFYIGDGSYIKFRNVRLAYAIPSQFASKLGMSRASAYISANNLATWTNYKGYDPEQVGDRNNPLRIGQDNLQYPRQRELLVGLNLTF